MKAVARTASLLALLVALVPLAGHAAELEQGVNQAGVIDFPTALNQPTTHTLHTTIELTDIAAPDLNLYNVRYGFQHGAFQLLTDLFFTVDQKPIEGARTHEFDYAQIRGKLQVLSLDEYRSYLALGILGRGVRHREERKARIDDKPLSLFAISTFEIFPFERWGGLLVNLYLDNRFFTLGGKFQLYQSIQLVGEVEHLHSTEREDKNNTRVGLSFEGVQNLYFQLLWTDEGANWLAQVGTGF